MGNSEISTCYLVGKPNAGKSSLFNQLTGLNQKIGNFSGVTVATKKGNFNNIEIIDLPGVESLLSNSPEATISIQHIIAAQQTQQGIVFIANGMQLYHSLILFSQIADLQIPCIFAINFKDEVEKSKVQVDIDLLKNKLGCQVVLINSKTGENVLELKQLISNKKFYVPNIFNSNYCIGAENNFLQTLQAKKPLNFWKEEHRKREQLVKNILNACIKIPEKLPYQIYANKADKILLHPIGGVLIFFGILYFVFQSVFYLSNFPMDWIDGSMVALSNSLQNVIKPQWLNNLVCQAIIPGITGVVIFIPQIAILFLLIGILEQIGYMSRISFIADNFLKQFGLSGHSVIPLLSAWACAIPAIMSTRIIENPRERFAVIMSIPFMTCSARLPIYAILITILFPVSSTSFFNYRGLALLALYFLGVVATLFTAWLVSKYSKKPTIAHWALELPTFRLPAWKNLCINVYNKTKSFVVQAGKIIFGISIILWLLASFSPKSNTFIEQQAVAENVSLGSVQLEYSYLGYAGKTIEPIIKPLGYDWKIGIALLSSFAAREVFVGTLSTIYSIESENEKGIIHRLKNEKKPNGTPQFNVATSVSLLLFYVFAMQCMSTLAVVVKETSSWKYAMVQLIAMSSLAYFVAFVAYQLLK